MFSFDAINEADIHFSKEIILVVWSRQQVMTWNDVNINPWHHSLTSAMSACVSFNIFGGQVVPRHLL